MFEITEINNNKKLKIYYAIMTGNCPKIYK